MSFYRWADIPEEKARESLYRKVVSGEKAMFIRARFGKGCILPKHKHENEQLSYVLKGTLKFLLQDREVLVREGEVLVIPSNVEHGAKALEDSVSIDVLSPIMKDLLAGTKQKP
jgi:quercetin dioxygenase-like cupin family protein